MPDRYVRQLGSVTDIDEAELPVGVDYDTVTIDAWRLSSAQAAEFAATVLPPHAGRPR